VSTLTSTIPGAILTLQYYMQEVASTNPSLDIGVYLGEPVESVANNFMVIGAYETWEPVSLSTYSWATIPASFQIVSESYALQGTIRAWQENIDQLGRLNDAFTMINGLHQALRNDPNAIALGTGPALTDPGSWGDFDVTMEAYGPLGDLGGWGVVLGFELHVINTRLGL
jgi:hypothetical protein